MLKADIMKIELGKQKGELWEREWANISEGELWGTLEMLTGKYGLDVEHVS